MNTENEPQKTESVTIGPYNISKLPPLPDGTMINIMWIKKEDGDGMSVDLDELWKDF